jgi:CRISPR-associated protein Csd1
MLLRLLRDRGSAETPGYQPRPIRAIVPLDGSGRYRGAFRDNADLENKRGARLLTPQVKRTSASRPILFADGADYLFGIAEPDQRAGVATERRDLHLALARRCVDATGNLKAAAALAFLTQVRDDAALAGQVAEEVVAYPGDYCLRVDDGLVTDEPDVQQFWAAELGLGAAAGGDRGEELPVCAVCGNRAHIPATWPVSIKGIPGGQSAGTQLVSMNSDVYESYGQKHALGAATCGPCGERIANALNALLSDRPHRLIMGPTAYVSWADGAENFGLFDFLHAPHPEAVGELLRSPLTARVGSLQAVDGRLHTVALSANAARAVVRQAIDTNVSEARTSLARFFDAQKVVGAWGEPATAVGVHALAGATVRDLKDLPHGTVGDLLAGILIGRALPRGLIASAMRRIHVQESPKVTHPQAALLTWFLTQAQKETAVPHQLDAAMDNPAYLCGRALAEVDAIQRTALGKVNASVVDRYFGAASSRPATVLGMLIRNAQDHLKKIRASNEPAAIAHERRLTEILARLHPSGFPATLPLIEQTWFCLGFYHQRAEARAAIQARRDAAENGQVAHEEALA